jgi:4-amino-4-deoxy-L-arabinose transferase
MSSSDRRHVWALLALLALLAFAFQGTRGLWEPDEGRYTSAGLNMYESGNWLVPTLDGEHPHLTKPPVTYWALAASFAVLGTNEWAARLPGALAFIGTGLLVFGLGHRFCPAKPWLPALAWSLSLAPMMSANIVSTDVILVLCETAAMFCFVEAWSRPATQRRRWMLLMWVCWGMAFMTKGPPGLLPLGAVVAFLAFHDRTRLRTLFPAPGLLLFAVVAFTWFALVIGQQPDRLKYFLGYEVYDRVFTAAHNRNAEWYGALIVYLPMFIVGLLPWWVMALVASGGPRPAWGRLRNAVRSRNAQALLLLYWFLLPAAVFFAARSRLQLYVLPLFVPLALLAGRAMSGWAWLTTRRLMLVAGATATVLLGVKGYLAYMPSDRDSRAMSAAIARIIDSQRVDEIVFVGMRPFYGLNLYLEPRVEGVQIEEQRFEYSRYVAEEDLCSELKTGGKNVYVMKRKAAERFAPAVERCEGLDPTLLGTFEADGNRLSLFGIDIPPRDEPPAIEFHAPEP